MEMNEEGTKGINKEEILKGELETIERSIAYLKSREDDMNGDLAEFLDMFTLLPMCAKEYYENAEVFRKYKYVAEAIERLEENLEEYGFKLLLPHFVYEYFKEDEIKAMRNRNNNRNRNHNNHNNNHKNKR